MDRVSLDSARTQLQVERRTIKMRLEAAVISDEVDPEALRARVRDFVKGVFEKHGVDCRIGHDPADFPAREAAL